MYCMEAFCVTKCDSFIGINGLVIVILFSCIRQIILYQSSIVMAISPTGT